MADYRCCVCQSKTQRNPHLHFKLRYTNKKHEIELQTKFCSSMEITVRQIIKDLIDILYLDDIPPEEVRLLGFSSDGFYHQLDITNTEEKLLDLKIVDGSILYFEPTLTASPPKLCRLTIVGPDENEKINFEWYRAKTTLKMLLEYVIEKFSLESIQRHRIHLFSIFGEFHLFTSPHLRLSEHDLYDGMSVYVRIIPPLSSGVKNRLLDRDVHVKYTVDCDKKKVIDVPVTEKIVQLKNKIQEKFEDNQIIEFKLLNEANDELSLNDTDRDLKSFGVKPGQTILAEFSLKKSNVAAESVNKSTERLSPSLIKECCCIVIITCPSLLHESKRLKLSVRHTVAQLIEQINTLIPHQRFVISEIASSTITVSFDEQVEKSQCLADLGFKPGDIIDVTIHRSIVSSSPDQKHQVLKTHQVDNMPIGLNNLGNSCYMNSALQCLAHIPPLTNFFLEGRKYAHMTDDKSTNNDSNLYDRIGDVTGAYTDLLWYLWKFDNHVDYSFKPTRIKAVIGEKDSRFATTDQEDVQEFMTFFLDAIDIELKENNQNTIIKQLFFGEMKSIIRCTACNGEELTTHPFSFLSIPLNRQEKTFWINFISKEGKNVLVSVDAPISGQVAHVVKAFVDKYQRPSLFYYITAVLADGELNFKTPLSAVSSDELVFLEQEDHLHNTLPEPVDIPVQGSTLEDCLQQFFSSEELDDEWHCNRAHCKQRTKATKQLKLSKLPPILIIQFKRFSHVDGVHQKINTFVHYPVTQLCLNKCLPLEEEASYTLIAVSNHTGYVFGGHYTACAKRYKSNGSHWYIFDDSFVERIKTKDIPHAIISRDAYLLFYMKRDCSSQEVLV